MAEFDRSGAFQDFLDAFKKRHIPWFGGVASYTRPPEAPRIASQVPSDPLKTQAKEPEKDFKSAVAGDDGERERPGDFEVTDAKEG